MSSVEALKPEAEKQNLTVRHNRNGILLAHLLSVKALGKEHKELSYISLCFQL